MRNLQKIVWSKPVESLIGLAMVVMGGFGAASDLESTTKAWAAVIAALGGVLLSWVTGTAYSRQQALAEVDDRLLTLSVQLGTETSNIELAVEQAQRGSVSSETCFALLAQSLNSLTNIVNQIQSQLGVVFDPKPWIDTREKINELTRSLGKTGTPTENDLEKVREELKALSLSLKVPSASLRQTVGTRSLLIPEQVFCPSCQQQQVVDVGSQPGATAQTSCVGCAVTFNIHRSSAGGVFSRPLGAGAQTPKNVAEPREVTCTECGFAMQIKLYSGRTTQQIVCTECGSGFEIDNATLKLKPSGNFEIVQGEVVDVRNSRPITNCPKCGSDINVTAIIRAPSAYFAICKSGPHLIRVDESAYLAFKDEAA